MPPSPPTELLARLTARPGWRREAAYALAAVVAAAVVALALVLPRPDPLIADHPITRAGHRLVPVAFADLPGFAEDDLSAAFATFLRSCEGGRATDALVPACLKAQAMPDPGLDDIRGFLAASFSPYRIEPAGEEAVLTAYYEPLVPGSRVRTARFQAPLYPLPPDLVAVTDANRPEGWDGKLTAARRTDAGLVPYPSRAEIDAGALDGRLTPLVHVEDAVEAFYIHIQGSTRILLPDGTLMRLGFAGRNGHPYSSVGRAMQEKGIVPPGGFSMNAMRAFFRANPEQAASLMQENRSYIFFREIAGLAPELGPIGGEGVPLTAGRSIAVDTAYHAYGTPLFIDAGLPTGPQRAREPFRRLTVAQDTGSAIKGPARIDLFWGTGQEAGSVAGGIKAAGTVYVLLPRP